MERKWGDLLREGLEDARRDQQKAEPIPQVYRAGLPVRPDGRPDEQVPFKGRRALFLQLERALGGKEGEGSTLLLVGQGRAGKTSALLQLERRLGAGIIPAYLDMQSMKLSGAADAAGLLEGLAEGVVMVARQRDLNPPVLTRTALRNDPYPAFGRWLDAVEKALGERRLLLCLDEFETLEQGISDGRFDKRLLDTLRHIVQHRRRVDVLLSGRRHLDELPTRWTSALINTLNLPISFLEQSDAQELIVHPVADFPDIYAPEAVERILYLSHCQPYLVQLLCSLIVERMNKAGRIPPASRAEESDVDAVVPLALERGNVYFSDLWRTETTGKTGQRILEALAAREDLRMDTAALHALVPEGRVLRTLEQRDIIARADGSFRLLVPLVGEYVRAESQYSA